MKTLTKKILVSLFAVLLAVSVALGVTVGLVGNAKGNRAISMADESEDFPAMIKLETDKEDIPAGGTFTLTVTLTSTMQDNLYWNAANLYIIPMDSDGVKYDTEIAKYLSYVTGSETVNDEFQFYMFSIWDMFDDSTKNAIAFNNTSLAMESLCVSTDTPMVMTTEIQVSEDFSDYLDAHDLDYKTVTFGIYSDSILNKISLMSFSPDKATDLFSMNGEIGITTVDIDFRKPSDETTLDGLELGHTSDDELTTIDLKEDTYTYSYVSRSPYLDDFVVLPTSENGATFEIWFDDSEDHIDAENGEKTNIDIPVGGGTLHILVTSESGNSTQEYTVKVTLEYAGLQLIDITTDTPTEGVTKEGIIVDFDPATLVYTAYIPSDATTITVTATILKGFGISSSIPVGTVECNAPLSNYIATSGAAFNITDVTAETTSSITLTVSLQDDGISTADEGDDETGSDDESSEDTETTVKDYTKQTYTVNFVLVSVDATIDSYKVIGADTEKEYMSDDAKSVANDVDYYFGLMESSQKGSFLITTTHDQATIAIGEGDDAEDYDEDTQYALGSYVVVVTAEAGNTKSYKVLLEQKVVIEIDEDSNYQYLTENPEVISEETVYFRRAYGELGWTHGIEDCNFEVIVLGQILHMTTVNTFLTNIAESQRSKLRIYIGEDLDLIYDCGNPGAGFSASDLDDVEYKISTGGYIELVEGGQVIEKVYLSVLGDVSGDGLISSFDTNMLYAYTKGTLEFDELPYRLAAYVYNSGNISSFDTNAIIQLGRETISADYYFWYPGDVED